MFGRNRKKLKEALQHLDNLMEQIEVLKGKSFLVSIERKGRSNIFTFMRGNELHQIETMGLMSDDVPGWKEKLLK